MPFGWLYYCIFTSVDFRLLSKYMFLSSATRTFTKLYSLIPIYIQKVFTEGFVNILFTLIYVTADC